MRFFVTFILLSCLVVSLHGFMYYQRPGLFRRVASFFRRRFSPHKKVVGIVIKHPHGTGVSKSNVMSPGNNIVVHHNHKTVYNPAPSPPPVVITPCSTTTTTTTTTTTPKTTTTTTTPTTTTITPLNITSTYAPLIITPSFPIYNTVVNTHHFIRTDESVFRISPSLLSLFDHDFYHHTNLNFAISPLATMCMLAELLLATHGEQHNAILRFLQHHHHSRARRSVKILPLTGNTYEETLYHSAFHWKLRKIIHDVILDKNYTAVVKNSLIYRKNLKTTRYFRNNARDLYHLKFIDRKELDLKWIDKHYGTPVRHLLKYHVNGPEVLLFSHFDMEFEWGFKFTQNFNLEEFSVQPDKTVEVYYWRGLVEDTVYVEESDFTMVALPLKGQTATMYVLLPNADKFHIHKLSHRLLHKFALFKNLKNLRTPRYDVHVKLPKIFPMSFVMDLTTPVVRHLMYTKTVHLHRVWRHLKLRHLIEHVSVTIKKGGKVENKSPRKKKRSGETIDFHLERPFLYVIMHDKTNAVMIWGTMADPSIE